MTADTDTTDVLFGSCYDTVRGWVRADAGAVTVAGIVGFTTKVMAMVQRQIRGDGERKKALVLAVLRKVIVCDAPLEEADRAALLCLLEPGGVVCGAIDAVVGAARGVLLEKGPSRQGCCTVS